MKGRLYVKGWAQLEANLFEFLIGALVAARAAATLLGYPPTPIGAALAGVLGPLAQAWLAVQIVAGVLLVASLWSFWRGMEGLVLLVLAVMYALETYLVPQDWFNAGLRLFFVGILLMHFRLVLTDRYVAILHLEGESGDDEGSTGA